MGVLFISHSSKDNDQAIKVRDWLRANGWSEVFLDLDPSQGLAPGQRWQEELKRAGERCSGVLALISPNWVASRWCQTEFLVADQLGKRIFPVFIAATPFDDLPLELKAKFQIADISSPEKETDGFQRLAFGLKRAGLDPKDFDWPPPAEPSRSVYRGLAALDVQDAAIFFGRDAMITKGLDELRRLRDGAPQRLMVILGASGAGKSSFLRAGLISRLKRDEENFLVLPVLRPERAAITGPTGLHRTLSAALGGNTSPKSAEDLVTLFEQLRAPVVDRFRRHAQAARETYARKPPTIVLPIDQTEEAFNAENSEGAAFAQLVAEAAHRDGNFIAVATIRTDSYEGLQRGLLPEHQSVSTLPPIPLGAFKEVIEGPARLAKPPLVVEPALTQQLLADLNAADALPLLAFTLERLTAQHGQDGRLSLADYRDKLGGLAGAIQSAVNEVLGAAPSKAELDLARRLFIPALVQVDTDGVKRRVAKRENLAAETLTVADRFVTQRLLVSDQGALEVAHEAILRQWPALAGWIAEERGALATLDGVRAAARDWRSQLSGAKGARGESWLLHRGERLKDAEIIAARPDFAGVVDEDMRAYLKACRKSERTQAGRRRGMMALLGVSALAVLGVGGAFVTQDQWRPRLEAHLNYGRPAAENTSAKLMQAAPGTTFQDCKPSSTLCPVMVVIPQGDFLMGERPQQQRDENDAPIVDAAGKPVMAPDERRRIPVARFAVSETEITFAHWRACVAGGGCDGKVPDDRGWEGDDRPVINVSWEGAKAYAQWLSQATGHEYRLLTEAEWEYAARGVTSADDLRNGANWSFGDDESLLRDFGWFDENSEGKSQPVRKKRANPFGLYDMHGNVWEWVEDCFAAYDPARLTSAAVETGGRSDGETACSLRVLRGGSWDNSPQILRSASRGGNDPTNRDNNDGFRLARTL